MGAAVLIEHSGYKKELRFVGKRTFHHPGYDIKNRTKNVMVCIDALKFPHEEKETQFRPVKVIRELVKSLSGFLSHPGLYSISDIGKHTTLSQSHQESGDVVCSMETHYSNS